MIILLTKEEPLFFESNAEVVDWVEAVDVERGEYEAFDQFGRRLALEIHYHAPGSDSIWSNVPVVEVRTPSDKTPTQLEKDRLYLSTYLQDFLARHGSKHPSSGKSVEELIRKCRSVCAD